MKKNEWEPDSDRLQEVLLCLLALLGLGQSTYECAILHTFCIPDINVAVKLRKKTCLHLKAQVAVTVNAKHWKERTILLWLYLYILSK